MNAPNLSRMSVTNIVLVAIFQTLIFGLRVLRVKVLRLAGLVKTHFMCRKSLLGILLQ